MRVLVTGGAGFIGSHVVDELVGVGHEVVVLDSLHPAAHSTMPEYLSHAAEYFWSDLLDDVAVRRAVAGVDAVCHQAAMVGLGVDFGDVESYVRANDLGTAVLLRVLHDSHFAGRVVLASSMVVYGEGAYRCPLDGLVRPAPRELGHLEARQWDPTCPRCGGRVEPEAVLEEATLDPRNIYAASKLHQEHLCSLFGREHDVAVIALRYHNVYGPRMPCDSPYAGVASIFRSAIESEQRPVVYEDGRQLRDFVHVRDVARANLLALGAPDLRSCALNVASGEPRTVLDLARTLSRVAGGKPPHVLPRARLGDVRHVYASTRAAHERIGFRARVDFDSGIAEFAHAPMRRPSSASHGSDDRELTRRARPR